VQPTPIGSGPRLDGRSILIVEDEPMIALDIAQAFELAGASVVTTNTLRQATLLVENDGLSAAVLDHALGDGTSDQLCERLKVKAIPFVTYSGFSRLDGACGEAPSIAKPADPADIVRIVARLLGR
jgi:DNA-binding NtrC family response regulator